MIIIQSNDFNQSKIKRLLLQLLHLTSALIKARDKRQQVVEIGTIKLNNIDAAIHEGEFPSTVLLGMSFLKELKMERKVSY